MVGVVVHELSVHYGREEVHIAERRLTLGSLFEYFQVWSSLARENLASA